MACWQQEDRFMVNKQVAKIIIPSLWSEQWGRHTPVGDNVCHYTRHTITPCLRFAKEMPVWIVCSLLTLHLSLLCILTRFWSPSRPLSFVFPRSFLDSSEYACGSLTFTIVKAHTSRRYPLTTSLSCLPATGCDVASVTDIWLLLSDAECCISTLKLVWNLEADLYSISAALEAVTVINRSSQNQQSVCVCVWGGVLQFYKNTWNTHMADSEWEQNWRTSSL